MPHFSNLAVFDEDFDNAAAHYALHMHGKTKAELAKELKSDWETHERLDSLVHRFAEQRTKHQLNVEGLSCISNNKLAQEIIAWLGCSGPSTPRKLLAHLSFLGISVPTWVTDSLTGLEYNEAVPQNIQCTLVFKAITAPIPT